MHDFGAGGRDWQDEVEYQKRLSEAEAEAEKSLIMLEVGVCES